MEDDWYSPNHVPPTPRTKPRPGELLYEFWRESDHRLIRCELRYHGEWGVEAQIYEGDWFRSGHRFPTRAEAVAWAEEMRPDLENGE